MEKILHDVLNAGIALFRSGEDTVGNAVKEVQRTYDELKEKGASDTSEAAVKLRKLLDDVVSQANELNSKAGTAYGDALAQLEEQYKAVVAQVEQMIPQDRVQEVKDKIEELTNVAKAKLEELRGGGSAPAGGAGGTTA